MNKHRQLVKLSHEVTEISRKVGVARVNWYAEDPARRARSGSWGAETDPVRQGQSVAGEFAVTKLFGLPDSIVRQDVDRGPDVGHDVVTRNGLRLDVKTTSMTRLYVLWSQAVNDKYWRAQFDHIVSVSIDNDNWKRCWVEGFLTKQEFFDRKHIADGVNDGGLLAPGTWFVQKANLSPIDILRAGTPGVATYDLQGRFIAVCACGKSAPYGHGVVSVRKHQFGEWTCKDHRPIGLLL